MASPEEMRAAMVANMKEKTGKTLEQWVALARKSKIDKHGKLVGHLKSEHGMTHGFANLVAHTTFQGDSSKPASAGDPVEAQYAGPKAGLRPIYDALVKRVSKLGGDVELAPKKAYVSLRRSKQFGLIQPSTKTRIDLGLTLKGVEPAGRLEAAGSFNSMVTHRVRLESPKDVDAEVVRWLRQAYEKA